MSECLHCKHPPHVDRRCDYPITEEIRVGRGAYDPVGYVWGHEVVNTCSCINTEITYQKSESCRCGARINVEGDEDTVLVACEAFRNVHRQKCPR